MKIIRICKLLLSVSLLSSCGNYLNRTGQPSDQLATEGTGLKVDFSIIKKSVFEPRCISCHSQYQTFQGVQKELSAIADAVTSNRMPKSGGPLSDYQKSLLSSWINQGSPENIDNPNTNIPAVELLPIWSSVSASILIPKCLVCHNPQGQAKFLDLSNRQSIFKARNRKYGADKILINFEKPEASFLLDILKDEEEPMPPTWSNIPRLSEKEITTISDWIMLGLP